MSKLHELLAAEGNLETQAIQTKSDLHSTFEKKRHLFEEKRSVFTSSEENGVSKIESQSDIQSTVQQELDWLSAFLVKAIDAGYQVSDANTRAKADIVLENGTILAKDIPATTLLELEKRLDQWVLQVLKAVPTLDPAKGFTLDTQRGAFIYKAREVTKTRTRKSPKPIVMYEATKEHPAQVQLFTEDIPIGTISEQEWSGLITPGQKSDMIDRAETLIRAVRQARSRANDEVVDSTKKIGSSLLDYVISGK